MTKLQTAVEMDIAGFRFLGERRTQTATVLCCWKDVPPKIHVWKLTQRFNGYSVFKLPALT